MIALSDVVLGLAAQDAPVVAIVAARLLVPLAIPRFPLVIVVVLVRDAADQTLLAAFTETDTTETGRYLTYTPGPDDTPTCATASGTSSDARWSLPPRTATRGMQQRVGRAA